MTQASSLADAVRCAVGRTPDAAIAFVEDAGAVQVCEVIRAVGDFPLIVLWQADRPGVVADCLDHGADAAVALPLPAQELAARVRAVMRRAAEHAPPSGAARVTAGALEIDPGARRVWWRGAPVDLTPTEFRLLIVLAETPGRVVTNRELLTRVWGPEYADDVHYVRLYVGYLRTKLGDDPHHPRIILNQWGVGYRLCEPEPAETVPASR